MRKTPIYITAVAFFILTLLLSTNGIHQVYAAQNGQPVSGRYSHVLQETGTGGDYHIGTAAEFWGFSTSATTNAGPWLSARLTSADQLQTSIKYEYLANRLLRFGIAQASSCPGNGLTVDGSATPCGVDAAYPVVKEWQNRFDADILSTARAYGLSPILLKGIFAQESQFWPGYYKNTWEAGLGHFTENGADTTLMWNQLLFNQVCATVFTQESCAKGYLAFGPGERAMLSGTLFKMIDASCDNCPGGVSVEKAKQGIPIFAAAIQAHSLQLSHIVRNTTGKTASSVASYEDMWRMTLGAYNAGSGCISSAIAKTMQNGASITWANVSQRLKPNCQGAVRYVNAVETFGSSMNTPLATAIPSSTPTLTPAASITPTVQP